MLLQPEIREGGETLVGGVADPTFHGTVVGFDVEVFIPVMMAPQIGVGPQTVSKSALDDRRARYLMVMGRLQPGATLTAAAAQTEVLSAQLASELSASETADRIKAIPIWESPYGAQTYMLPAVTVPRDP